MDTKLFNQKLKAIFSNGHGEVGLEVGTDAGLALDEFIQIPKCMKKPWCAKLDAADFHTKTGTELPKRIKPFYEGASCLEFMGEVGWVTSGNVQIHNGQKSCQVNFKNQFYWIKITEFHIDQGTVDDLKAFFSVNVGHIRDLALDVSDLNWVHAIRYWATVAGFVVSTKSNEYTIVDDPESFAAGADDFVKFAINYSSSSWTACAARATSWRKTNHATGGEIASGYPRRWLVKENKFADITDKQQRLKQERQKTAAFYIATHGSSVHVILSMMAKEDKHHWSEFDPSYGFIQTWDVGQSTTVRMSPADQVAGSAIVVDSLVVLKMLLSEGLVPLLMNIAQINSLIDAYDKVNNNSVACAIYSKWFLDGHPLHHKPVFFSQRDPSFLELAVELAIVAQRYYTGSTISASAALQNISQQATNEMIRTNWASITTSRKDIASNDFVIAVKKLKGGITADAISDLISDDVNKSKPALEEYNRVQQVIANRLNIKVGQVRFESVKI